MGPALKKSLVTSLTFLNKNLLFVVTIPKVLKVVMGQCKVLFLSRINILIIDKPELSCPADLPKSKDVSARITEYPAFLNANEEILKFFCL